jgi:C4-dicarboxylate-specific signal transduction histidine kinase/ABC-type uncharacterized transport system substrate-binding protein
MEGDLQAIGPCAYSDHSMAETNATVRRTRLQGTKAIVLSISVLSAALGAQTKVEKPQEANVLLLAPGNGRPIIGRIVQGIQEEIGRKGGIDVKVQPTNVDLRAERDPRLHSIQTQWFRARYGDERVNLLIAVGASVLPTATELRDAMWPSTPIVFCCLDQRFLDAHPSRLTTGVFAAPDWAENVRLAMQLFPNTRHVALIGGGTGADHALNDPLLGIVRKVSNVELINLTNLLLPEQLARARALPPNTVIMFGTILEDISGRRSGPLAGGFRLTLAHEANAPVFFAVDSSFSPGGLGGYMVEDDELGREAGSLAYSVLTGRTRPDVAPETTNAIHLRLNWSEINRWGISRSRIPKDAAIDFAPPSLWESHAEAVIVAIVALVAQTLLIAFLLAERKRRQSSQVLLAERLRFETIVAQVSSDFARNTNGQIDKSIQDCLQAIQSFFGGNTASIWESRGERDVLERTHVWPRDAAATRPITISATDFRGTVNVLSRGESMFFSNEKERENLEDNEAFRRADIQSFLAVPLRNEEDSVAFLSLTNRESETIWPVDIVSRLRVLADIIATALARLRTTHELHTSESLRLSLLESIQGGIAIIDQEGSVLEVNRYWLNAISGQMIPFQSAVYVGANYLELCGRQSSGKEVVEGIQSVLGNRLEVFEIEYEINLKEQRWYRLTVQRLLRSQGGAIVSHRDITRLKLAELEGQRLQQDLIFLNRSSEMGRLTASLAHELAQPMSASLSNAQAALRLATMPDPDLIEIQAALNDIVEDDQRARDVLSNIRSILKKQPPILRPVSLNAIVSGVMLMVKSNAQMRSVQIEAVSPHKEIFVNGDEISLQQVLINLINNAMDAMDHLPTNCKTLTVKAELSNETKFGILIVEDSGAGIPEGLDDRLFSPFFTTKTDGLGIGLTICRSILQRFGGSLSCRNRPEGGASFRVELPISQYDLFVP